MPALVGCHLTKATQLWSSAGLGATNEDGRHKQRNDFPRKIRVRPSPRVLWSLALFIALHGLTHEVRKVAATAVGTTDFVRPSPPRNLTLARLAITEDPNLPEQIQIHPLQAA